jgi:GntR family transcriptional regulator
MQSGYRKVAAVVRSGIERGNFAPDTTLPKQTDIAHSFGVNVGTVRKAVALLEAEGLVTPVRRRGTVVRPRPPMRRLGIDRYAKSNWKFSGLVAFAADREASGRPWARTDQTQTVHSVPADPEVAEAFGIETGQPVYERARLVKEGPTPTHMLTSYYLPEHVEGTPFVDPTPGPAGPGGGFAVLTIQGLEPQLGRSKPPWSASLLRASPTDSCQQRPGRAGGPGGHQFCDRFTAPCAVREAKSFPR